MPFWRRKREPSFREQVRMQGDEERISSELSDPNYSNMMTSIPFDTKVLEDGRFDRFFNPQSVDYHPCYAPLEPWCTSRLHLGLLTDQEARDLCQDIESAEGECDRLAQYYHAGPLEYARITNLASTLKWLISMRARKAVLLRALTTQRRVVEWTTPEKKKR